MFSLLQYLGKMTKLSETDGVFFRSAAKEFAAECYNKNLTQKGFYKIVTVNDKTLHITEDWLENTALIEKHYHLI